MNAGRGALLQGSQSGVAGSGRQPRQRQLAAAARKRGAVVHTQQCSTTNTAINILLHTKAVAVVAVAVAVVVVVAVVVAVVVVVAVAVTMISTRLRVLTTR